MASPPRQGDRLGVLGAVRNPLVFFALALLVIEGVFGLVVTKSEISPGYQFVSLCLMMVLFLVVVGVVALITVRWPAHLYEKVGDQLAASTAAAEFVNSTAFQDAIEDVVVSRVRPECLS